MLHDLRAEQALKIIGIGNLIFVMLFFSLFHFVSPARADQTSDLICQGQSLINEIKAQTPDAYAKALDEAALITNGEGLLWRIEKDGAEPSYLFGTMHVTDDRALTLPKPAQTAFEESDHLIIETTEVLDPQKASTALMSRPDLMMFTDGTNLETLIPTEELGMVSKALKERGMPLSSVRLMKPWMISSALTLPACEAARKVNGKEILDITLARRAEAAGMSVSGLETIVEQLDAMASLPMDNHIQGLIETIRMGDKADDIFETMLDLYSKGQIALIMPMLKAALASDVDAEAADQTYADFEETMINVRNKNMANRMIEALNKGKAFVAVGALHLPGDEGLVAMLQNKGYTVSRVPGT